MSVTHTSDLFSLRGKTAVVTGGSRGIGAMIARGLLDAGAEVLISARKANELEAARESLSAHGTVHAVRADVSTLEGVTALAEEISKVFPYLDILVNNAGATWGMPLDEFDEHAWDKVMDTNVKGVFFLTQKLLPNLRGPATADDPSRVINIGSIDGLHVNPMDTYSYAASKAGVHHLTRSLARKLGPQHITVNAVAPGVVLTEMGKSIPEKIRQGMLAQIPLGRFGEPDDIANAILFLADVENSFVTGTIMTVDGGWTAGKRM